MSEDTSLALLPGQIIEGKYRVVRVLGVGGMGVVAEAEHLSLAHRCAIKVLQGKAARDPEALRRFVSEARALSQLDSEHIVRVHDFGSDVSGDPFIVMELLKGFDIAHLIRARAPMPVAEAVDLVVQACVGLAVAHAAGFVHRDIKPANLFVAHRADRSIVVKVLDFGLTKALRAPIDAALTQSASTFGTPQYMAPEQIMSAKHVDARCDQHALGMILFEMLTGRPAFVAPSTTAVTVAIATQPAPSARRIVPSIPRTLDEALMTALGKKPKHRYDDIAAFAEAIAPYGTEHARHLARTARRTLVQVDAPPHVDENEAEAEEGRSTVPLDAPTIGAVSRGAARVGPSSLVWALGAMVLTLGAGTIGVLAAQRADSNTPAAVAPPATVDAASSPRDVAPPIGSAEILGAALPAEAVRGPVEVLVSSAEASSVPTSRRAPPRRAPTEVKEPDPVEVFGGTKPR